MSDQAQVVAAAADRYFQDGLNCAQAVLKAAAETHGFMCTQCIPAAALAMGGGVGHTGCACGAVTGAVMAIGLAVDRATEGGPAEKKRAAYAAAGPLVRAFAEKFGSADCRGVLGFDWAEPGAMDRARRENIKAAKCTPCVRWAAAEASRIIARMPGE
jgi:C_GCAxxG_C_C family probable redox protein